MERVKFTSWDKVTQKGYAMIQIEGTYVGGDKDGRVQDTQGRKVLWQEVTGVWKAWNGCKLTASGK